MNRKDLLEGRLHWSDLPRLVYWAFDATVHYQGLQSGVFGFLRGSSFLRRDMGSCCNRDCGFEDVILPLDPICAGLRERNRPERMGQEVGRVTNTFGEMSAIALYQEVGRVPASTMRGQVSWSWPRIVRDFESSINARSFYSPGSTLQAPITELRSDLSELTRVGTLDQAERKDARAPF